MREGRNTPAPSEYGPAEGIRLGEVHKVMRHNLRSFPFGQQNVLHRTPVESSLPTGPASGVFPPHFWNPKT